MEKQEWTIGPMYARFEAPNILYSRGEGASDAESVRAFNRLAEELAARHGKLYLIADMSKATSMDAEARKASNEFNSGVSPFIAMVVCGASFTMRTVVSMMLRAGQLLGRQSNLHFVATEADAREWIAAHRDQSKAV